MELLICVLNREELLDEVMSGWLAAGIRGATVIRSQGMGRVLSSDEQPAITGLVNLIASTRPQNVTVFTVVESTEQADAAIQVVERLAGGLDNPSTGIAFTIPINRVVGLVGDKPAAGARGN